MSGVGGMISGWTAPAWLRALDWSQRPVSQTDECFKRLRDGSISILACAALLFAHMAHTSGDAAKGTPDNRTEQSQLWHGPYLKLFRGPHVPRKLSKITIRAPLDWQQTDERIGVFAFGTKVVEFLQGALTFEWEAIYGDHWGTQEFHEIGTVLYARWNRFPWNDYIRTTFQVGIGPSLTSEPAHYEPRGGIKSLWLMQVNFEIDVYSPAKPGWALIFRIQHRSGMYTLINDVRGGSNFLTIGLRRQF